MNNSKPVGDSKPAKRGRGRPPKKPKVEEFQGEKDNSHSSSSGVDSIWGKSKLIGGPPPAVKVTTIRRGHPKFSANGSLLVHDDAQSSDRADKYTGQVFKVSSQDYEKVPIGGMEEP